MEKHSTPPPLTGLLSPIPSFASLASLFTPSYSAPSTPVRSTAKTTHSSPLVKRLLLPFEPTTPTSTPIQAHFMPLNSSSSSTTGPRSSTLSETLLRDTLMRDEGKDSVSPQRLPLDPASAGKHRRRHSHVPLPHLSSPSHDDRDLTKGSFLFRTPMSTQSTAGAPPSPTTSTSSDERMRLTSGSRPGHCKSQSVSVAPSYYGGDAERGSSSPITPQNPSCHTSQRRSNASRPRGSSPAHPSRSSHAHADARSVSPSPLRRRDASLNRHAPLSQGPNPARAPSNHTSASSMYTQSPPPGTQTPTRPSPSQHQRRETTESSTRRSAPPPPIQLPTQGEPLEMTPHEQVLRARLERVLSVGRVVEKRERERRGRASDADEYRFGTERERRERERDARSRSGSVSNEVRDEEGGWPWRERERMTSSPLQSSSSGNSQDSSSVSAASLYLSQTQSRSQASRSPARAYPTPSRSTSPHVRTRSKTDSTVPAPSVARTLASTPTPRRHSTAPTTTATPGSVKRRRPTTGTTPPLVHGDAEEDEEHDLKLITPPSTPPFVAQPFNLGGQTYYPSPYKSEFESPLGVKGKRGPGSGLGMRRPLGPPMHMQPLPTVYGGEDEDEGGFMHSSSSELSSARSRSPSRSRSSFSCGCPPNQQCLCPPAPHPYHLQQPTFNARKASARCRAIEGYVSFAAVEGLGEPVDPLSPCDDDRDHRQGQANGGWGVGLRMGFKKFLGVVPGAHGEEGQGERGVVL